MKKNQDVISWAMELDRTPCQLEASMRGYGLTPNPDDKTEDLREHLLTHLSSLDPLDVAAWQPPDEIEEPHTFLFVRDPEDIMKDVIDGYITDDEGIRQLINYNIDGGLPEEKATMFAIGVVNLTHYIASLQHAKPQATIVTTTVGSARDPFKRTTRRPRQLPNRKAPLSRGTGTNASVKKVWHWLKTH